MSLAEAMFLTDLELNTVDFVPNLDNSQKEPSLLPARISSLLLNDSSGIAVGMATNIPPHNLGELVDALSVIIQNPEATEGNLHPGDVQEHVYDNMMMKEHSTTWTCNSFLDYGSCDEWRTSEIYPWR